MDLDFLNNFTQTNQKEQLTCSKKDILKILKRIGVDTRFISYYEDNNQIKLYIENLRFSKFSKKRVESFNNYYENVEVIRSSLFQKICLRSSKTLAKSLKPKTNILIPKLNTDYNKLLYIILEPYSRKYGINFIEYRPNLNLNKIDTIVSPLNLNEEVNSILTDIFEGKGIIWDKKLNNIPIYYNNDKKIDIIKSNKPIIFPLINVPKEWINDFLNIKTTYKIDYNNENVANSFMVFLSKINPQFKENILSTSTFLESNQK